MKAISLLQPWASLVVMGLKTIETRSWSTAYRGEILIHASTGKSGAGVAGEAPLSRLIPDFKGLPFGAIIGQAVLTDVVRVEHLPLPEARINQLSLEQYAFGQNAGRFAWMLEEVQPFERPIFVKGTLGLWEYSGPLS